MKHVDLLSDANVPVRFSHSSEQSIAHYSSRPPSRGGGTPLYGLYRYVRPQRAWFINRFGHK